MDERDERMRGTSLVAAITVSGRHAFLVGYQPDEALRPSLASSLSLSLPLLPSVHSPSLSSLFLSLLHSSSFEISFSFHVVASRAGGEQEFIDGTLYLYAHLSLCSPELTGPWKNLGRMLLTSNYSFYLMILICNFLCAFDAVDTD